MAIKEPNIFKKAIAVVRMILFWAGIFIQVPIIFLLPTGPRSVAYMRIYMWWLKITTGLRVRVHGKLTDARPLLVVSNHISVFEIAMLSYAFGGSFVGKNEVSHWPVIGPIAKKFGVVFVDRNPATAAQAITKVNEQLSKLTYPLFIFAEGTTTNGAYVKPFKSAMFNIVENSNITVQPVVVNYRTRHGDVISDKDIANHLAYFSNAKMDMGPLADRERSAFAQLFHVMALGGFMIEITVLPPPPITGKDRKQIAETLYEMVSKKYMELKDKPVTK